MSAAYPPTELRAEVERLIHLTGSATRSIQSGDFPRPTHGYRYGYSNPALRPIVTDSPNWFDLVNHHAASAASAVDATNPGLADRQVATRSLASPRA